MRARLILLAVLLVACHRVSPKPVPSTEGAVVLQSDGTFFCPPPCGLLILPDSKAPQSPQDAIELPAMPLAEAQKIVAPVAPTALSRGIPGRFLEQVGKRGHVVELVSSGKAIVPLSPKPAKQVSPYTSSGRDILVGCLLAIQLMFATFLILYTFGKMIATFERKKADAQAPTEKPH